MMLLYAVTATTPDVEAAVSTTTPLRAHRSTELTALVEPRSHAPERTMREVLAFARVLRDLWSRFPLLPVRFGTTVADAAELEELIAQHRTEWADRLAAVTGHSECIVHIHGQSEPFAAGTTLDSPAVSGGQESGSDYLHRRARQVRHQDTATSAVRALLAPYASEVAALPPTHTDEARLSFLVRDDLVEQARSAVLDWAPSPSDVSFTGPWPPFSFCGEETA